MQTDLKPSNTKLEEDNVCGDPVEDSSEQFNEQPKQESRKKAFQPKKPYRAPLEDDDEVDLPADVALGDVKDIAEKKRKKATKPPTKPKPEPIPMEPEPEETPEPEVEEPLPEAPAAEEEWPQTPDSDKTNDAPIPTKKKQSSKQTNKSPKKKPVSKVTNAKPPWQGWKKKPDYLSNQNALLDV